MNKTTIRIAEEKDIVDMVSLSHAKRKVYEKFQPQFWRYKEGAEAVQEEWFKELLNKDDYILLVAESDNEIIGFVIGRIVPAPDVYDPGGLTLMIDDFCVKAPELWEEVGAKLIAEIKSIAKFEGASQILVVSGALDMSKCEFLKKLELTVASEWYVGGI